MSIYKYADNPEDIAEVDEEESKEARKESPAGALADNLNQPTKNKSDTAEGGSDFSGTFQSRGGNQA